MVDSLKEVGVKTSGMERDSNAMPMVIPILVTLILVKPMGKVFILGVIRKFLMVNGIKGLNMVMASGKVFTGIHLSANGFGQKRMDMVCTRGQMVIDTRENGYWD